MEQLDYQIISIDTDLSEKYIACACSDNVVRICTFTNEKITPVATLTGHTDRVTKAVYINYGELLASSDFSGNLIIWKLEGSAYVQKVKISVVPGCLYDITARMVTNNSFEIYCACDTGVVKTLLFNSSLNHTMTTKEVHKYGATSISCNKDYVVSAGVDLTVALQGFGTVQYFKSHSATINSVAIAPANIVNKTIFASCSEDGMLIIYQGKNNEFKEQKIMLKDPVHSLSWNITGFVLTVGYGTEGFKSYIQGENGNEFVEVRMKALS